MRERDRIVNLQNGGHYIVWLDLLDEWKVGANFESAGYMTASEALAAGEVLQEAAFEAARRNVKEKS